MKKIKQTKENKRNFKSYLLNDLKERNYTREELVNKYGKTDSAIREEVGRISMFYPIISHSKKKGYRICNVKELLEENDTNHINSEIEELKHTINELNSRIKMLKKRQRALIGALKVLEKGK